MNPLTKALHIVLYSTHASGGDRATTGDEVAVYDYSSKDDFEALWDLARPRPSIVIIVWSDIAADEQMGPVNVAEVLTPVDWAIANAGHCVEHVFTLSFAPDDGLFRSPEIPHVLVLDTRLAQTPSQPSVEYFDSLKPQELPWLKVEREISLAKIVAWLAAATKAIQSSAGTDNVAEKKARLQEQKKAVERFLRAIRSNLTQEPNGAEYDHHAIANLVGPMILRGEAATPSLHAQALLALLQACGLAVEAKTPDPTVWSLPNDVELILVDDQAEDGWRQWVEESLNTPVKRVICDPTELVELIEEGFLGGDEMPGERGRVNARAQGMCTTAASGPDQFVNGHDLRFRLFDGIAEGKIPVVLLDLRLFAGNTEEERDFYERQLLPLIDSRFSNKAALAWDDKRWTDSTYFQDARNAVKNKRLRRGSSEHHEALTWLPRVLALADMSLPIVLFSSTERKSIVTPLLPYRNIFLSFQKPSLLTLHGPLTRDGAVDRLRETVEHAAELGNMRRKCQQISGLARRASLPQKSTAKQLHIEVYLDEALTPKSPNFAVGGLFAIFNSVTDANRFDDMCVSNGLRYFEEQFFPPISPKAALHKFNDTGAPELEEALKKFGKDNVQIGYLRIKRDHLTNPREMEREEADALAHRMLAGVIELFCAESLPAILRQRCIVLNDQGEPSAPVTLAVHHGTRMVFDPAPPAKGRFTYRQNIEIQDFPKGRGLRSMGGRDAFPIVRNALGVPGRLPLPYVRRAVAVSLPYAWVDGKSRADRVVNHAAMINTEFSLERHTETPSLVIPCNGAFGRVAGINPRGDTLFVWVKDVKVACFARYWNLPTDYLPSTDDVVKLNLEMGGHDPRTGQPGVLGKDVVLACEDDLHGWISKQTPQVKLAFYAGTRRDDWRVDFRALHYVADQILDGTGPDSYKQCLSSDVAGQFDCRWDEETRQCIAAGRSLDRNELSDALRLYQANEVAATDVVSGSANALLAGRLAEELHNCRGDVLWIDSPRSTHRSANGDSDNYVHRQPKQKDRQRRLDKQIDPTRHKGTTTTDVRPAAESPKAKRRAYLDELGRRWRIRTFRWEAAYVASGGNWDKKPEFDVRVFPNGRFVIFAKVHVASNLDGFALPKEPEWFVDVETPAGKKYSPK